MDEIEWTHEQLNAFESLEKGEVNELIKLLLSDGLLNEALRNRLSKQLSEGNFVWHPKKAKIGRPTNKKWDDWAYIGLARRKSELIEQQPNLRVIDIEYQMANEYALNRTTLELLDINRKPVRKCDIFDDSVEFATQVEVKIFEAILEFNQKTSANKI